MVGDTIRALVRRGRRESVRRSWFAGAVGGFLATVVMTLFREPAARSFPPTARFWTRYVADGDPDDHPLAAFTLHLLYGTVGGIVYGNPIATRLLGDSEAVAWFLCTGTAYGAGLSLFGSRVVLPRLLDVNLSADEAAIFHAGHLVYGLTLGAWVGTRQSRRGRSVDDAFEHS